MRDVLNGSPSIETLAPYCSALGARCINYEVRELVSGWAIFVEHEQWTPSDLIIWHVAYTLHGEY